MGKRKSEYVLLQELKAVDAFLKERQTTDGGCFNCKAFSHLMRAPGGLTYAEAMKQGILGPSRFAVYCTSLRQRGYLTYKGRKEGGWGWAVVSKYAATEGEGAVKVTVLDKEQNLKSKLNPADQYLNALELITHLRNIAPTTTVNDLYAMLKRFPEYEELCGQHDTGGQTSANIQKELEGYGVDSARLFANGCPQDFTNVNMWQLYRIAQALGVAPVADMSDKNATCQVENVTRQDENVTDDDPIATYQDDTDAPF